MASSSKVDRAQTFVPGDKVCDALFFNDPSKRHLAPLRNRDKQYSEGGIEVDVGIQSDDYEFLMFKHRLASSLTKALPATVDDQGRVTGNGIRSNFHGLNYVGGYPQNPATYPLVDNTYLREKEKGLKNQWTKPWHETCARALTRLFFRGIAPVPVKIRVGSSSMMPFYTKQMNLKLDLVRHALSNGKRAGELIMEGNHVDAWVNYYIGGAYHTVYRRQATDAVIVQEDGSLRPKDRPVADLTYALTGGRGGSFAPANRELVNMEFRLPGPFFRERNRTAMGGPLGLNANLMVIAQAVRAHIYKTYAYTYHHTTRLSQQEDVQKMGFIIAADVSNHDWFWPTWVVDTIADELLKLGYAEWWVALYRLRMKLPNYVTDVAPGEGNILLGDWRDPSNQGGLPSGNSFTDLDGAWLMTLVYFIMQVEHTYPELIAQLGSDAGAERVLDAYLRGTLPIKLKDKSDDALLGWSDPHLQSRAQALHDKMSKGESVSDYMSISYEHGGAFLGSVLLYPESRDTSRVTLIGNGASLVYNMFSPEFGIQSALKDRTNAKRPYPGLAWATLSQNYGTAPSYTEILDQIEFNWSKIYHESFRIRREKWLRESEKQLMLDLRKRSATSMLPDLDPITLEVLMDPSKLEWKYAAGDVSSSISDLLFNGIPLEEVEPFFKEIYHG